MSGRHYDPDEIEKLMRGLMRADTERARARAGGDPEILRQIDLSARFYELAILSARLCAQAENEGAARSDIGVALAVNAGTLAASYMTSCGLENALQFHTTYLRTVEALLQAGGQRGRDTGDAIVSSVAFTGTAGGHA